MRRWKESEIELGDPPGRTVERSERTPPRAELGAELPRYLGQRIGLLVCYQELGGIRELGRNGCDLK